MFLSVDPEHFLEALVSGPSLDLRRPNNPFRDMQQPPTTEADMRQEYVSLIVKIVNWYLLTTAPSRYA